MNRQELFASLNYNLVLFADVATVSTSPTAAYNY